MTLPKRVEEEVEEYTDDEEYSINEYKEIETYLFNNFGVNTRGRSINEFIDTSPCSLHCWIDGFAKPVPGEETTKGVPDCSCVQSYCWKANDLYRENKKVPCLATNPELRCEVVSSVPKKVQVESVESLSQFANLTITYPATTPSILANSTDKPSTSTIGKLRKLEFGEFVGGYGSEKMRNSKSIVLTGSATLIASECDPPQSQVSKHQNSRPILLPPQSNVYESKYFPTCCNRDCDREQHLSSEQAQFACKYFIASEKSSTGNDHKKMSMSTPNHLLSQDDYFSSNQNTEALKFSSDDDAEPEIRSAIDDLKPKNFSLIKEMVESRAQHQVRVSIITQVSDQENQDVADKLKPTSFGVSAAPTTPIRVLLSSNSRTHTSDEGIDVGFMITKNKYMKSKKPKEVEQSWPIVERKVRRIGPN